MQGNSPENKDGTISERQSLFFLIGFVLFWIGMLFYDIALIIIASFVTLGSVAVGVFFILRSYEAGDAEHQAISGEIEQMSNDASFDVTEELIFGINCDIPRASARNSQGGIATSKPSITGSYLPARG